MAKNRRNHTSQQKAAILREHLVEKTPVSDLCDKHGIHPTLFYRWQKRMFENLQQLFDGDRGSRSSELDNQNQALREKLAQKDMVISEIMEDYVQVKKTLGDR
jgi:transposase